MIDFNNKTLFKLSPLGDDCKKNEVVECMLVDGETIIQAFKAMRDLVFFTNKRIISVNVQGLTGKKQDFTSMPYSKIQAWSIETSGMLDLDCELDIWFSGVIGKVRFEIKSQFDIKGFNKVIGQYVL